ncbi:tat protein [Human immunodeficiency virus]|nr:tat protein [Human immunodeficiency virus]
MPPWHHPGSQPQTPCNTCYCKKCCYHCYVCFTSKGLGISYGRKKRRRRPAVGASRPDNKAFVPEQPTAITDRKQKRQEEQEKEVEKKAGPD